MLRLLFIALLASALVACGQEEKQPTPAPLPIGVLDADSMAIVLADIHYMEAALRNRTVRKLGLEDEARLAFKSYFDTTAVSESRFRSSLDHWRKDFESMEQIYVEAMEIMSTRMAQAKKEIASESEDDQ